MIMTFSEIFFYGWTVGLVSSVAFHYVILPTAPRLWEWAFGDNKGG